MTGARVKSALRWIVPHGVLELRDRRAQLLRLGLDGSRALRAARSGMYKQTNVDCLPDLALRSQNAVIDVGANVGSWSKGLLSVCSPDLLLAIEASPDVVGKLRASLAGCPTAQVVECAIGDRSGLAEFHVTAHSHGSSVLRPRSEEMDRLYGGGYEVQRAVEVPMRTLDDVASRVGEINILKIDVQGFEAAVLAGAPNVLSRTRFVILEVTFQSHYEGDSSFWELHAAMTEHGFRLLALAPASRRSGQAMWADAVYERG